MTGADRGRCVHRAIDPPYWRRAIGAKMTDLTTPARGLSVLERPDIALVDTIDQKDQPVHRLALRARKVRARRKRHRDLAKFRPAPVEIDQVARRFFAPAI